MLIVLQTARTIARVSGLIPGLWSRCMALQLLRVVHQGKQLPLRIDLATGAQGKSSQSLGMQMAEDRLDDSEAAAVDQPTFSRIDPGFHGGSVRMGVLRLAAVEEGHLPIRTDLRLAQALHLLRTGAADLPRALEADAAPAFDDGTGGPDLSRWPSGQTQACCSAL